MRKRILAAALLGQALLLGLAGVAGAEVRSYDGEGEYIMSDFETPDVAKQRAKARAEQNAQEKAGVFVSSYTRTQNLEVAEDEVIVIASGIMKVTETTYEREHQGDMTLVRARVKADIDSDEIQKWLDKGIEQRSAMAAQAKELLASIEAQEKEIAELKRRLAEQGSPADKEQLRSEIAANDKAFLANQKIEAGNRAYFASDWNGAIAGYSEALAIYPGSDIAYRYRGAARYNAGDCPGAIADFSGAIELSPESATAYVGRGAVYIYLKDYAKALADMDRAVALDPRNGMAYYNRGICRQALGDIPSAKEDFAKAASLGVS